MAEGDVVVTKRGAGRGTTLLALLALLVALAALWLGWMAYERTGVNLDQRIQQEVQRAGEALDTGAQEAEEAIDAGPDGVDEDDTDPAQPDATTETNNTAQ